MLKIVVLGAPHIELEGQRIATFESRTADALLYYLAVNGGIHTRESLAEFFWPERTQEQSLNNLRTVLFRLRRDLEHYLEITRSTVKLKKDSGLWIDIEHWLQVSHEINSNALTADTASQLETILTYYRGPLLDGFYLRHSPGFEDWLRQNREAWQIRATDAMGTLITWYIQNDNYLPAMSQVERLIQIDPLREQSYWLKMRLLSAMGQQDKALEVYRSFEALLRVELDDVPSPELQRLFEQISASQSGQSDVQRLTLNLAAMTQHWADADRHPDYLATGKALEQLQVLLLGRVGLSELEREFIDASLAQRQQYLAEERAKQNEERALRLALKATEMLDRNKTGELMALLAIRSLELTYTAEGDSALLKALQKPLLRQRFSGHQFRTIVVTASPDGRYLLSAGTDKTIRLWDAHECVSLRVISDVDAPVRSLAFSPDSRHFAAGGAGPLLRIWATDRPTPALILDGHRARVQCVAWSQDGELIASGDADGGIHVWHRNSGELVCSLNNTAPVDQISFSPDDLVLYVVTAHSITLWDVAAASRIDVIETAHQHITAICVLSRNHVLVGTNDGSIQHWDCSTARMIDILKSQTTAVAALWEEDGQIIAVHQNGQMQGWHFDNNIPLWTRTFPAEIHTVARSADNRLLFVGGSPNADFCSFPWIAPTQSEPRLLTGHRGCVTTAEFSPDGTLIASSSWDSTVRIWDSVTGRVQNILQHPDGHALKAVTFTPDGRSVVSSCDDGVARRWDVETGALLQSYAGHTDAVTGVAVSRRGNHLLTGSHDQTMRLWDTLTGDEIRCFEGHDGAVYRVKFSPDDRFALSPSADCTARLWNIQTGELVMTFRGHAGWVTGTAFSPDGRYLVTTSFDQTARLWDVVSGVCVRIFAGHTALVRHAAFSPDGRFLATSSDDCSMRLWDIETGKQVRIFSGHEHGLWQMGFAPDGRSIVSASADYTIRIWHVHLSDVIATARKMLQRELSPSELSEYGIE